MDVRNKDHVILRMRAPVFTKLYEMVDFLCPLIAEACIHVCPKNPVNFNVDNVRVAKLLGTSVGANKTFKGMVLKVDTVVGSIQRIEKAKVTVTNEQGGVATVLLGASTNIKIYELLERAVVNGVNTYKIIRCACNCQVC